MRPAALAFLALSAAGCTPGFGSGSGGQDAGQSNDPDSLATAAGASAPWQVMDLATGRVRAAVDLDPADARYRDRYAAFRRIDLGRRSIGQSGGAGRQADETSGSADCAPFYIAATELTRAQWRRIAGTEPWLALRPPPAGDGDDLPATGMSLAQAAQALATWNLGHASHLRLPAPAQWEVAARGGSAAIMPWGDTIDPAASAVYARTWDAGAPSGPGPVGALRPNPLGLHDCCGNVWEFTDDGMIRGGSWGDALVLARPANRAEISPETGHETVGLRLVYAP